jgi:hypothetical protein
MLSYLPLVYVTINGKSFIIFVPPFLTMYSLIQVSNLYLITLIHRLMYELNSI